MTQEKQVFCRKIALGEYRETRDLTGSGYCYENYSLDHLVWAAAVRGAVDDWAVYIESPYMRGRDFVPGSGIKMHEETAREMFPEWADQFTYRR